MEALTPHHEAQAHTCAFCHPPATTVGMIRILSGPGLSGYLNLSHAAYLPVAFLDPLSSVVYAALCPGGRLDGYMPSGSGSVGFG